MIGRTRREFFDRAELALNAESGFSTCWANFGHWEVATDYPSACQALARRLGDAAALRAGHRVLDLGFGMGEQLRIWRRVYGVKQITGLNPSASQTAHARKRFAAPGTRLLVAGAETLSRHCPPASVDRVLALDCAYHFTDQQRVFSAIRQALAGDGQFAMTDLLLSDAATPASARLLPWLTGLARIPRPNLMSWPARRAQLQAAGFEAVTHQDLTAAVFEPFAHWWRGYRHQLPRARRIKFDVTAAAVATLARSGLLRYGLITAAISR